MQIKVIKKVEPVEITLETQEEIDLLYAILNFTPLSDALNLRETDSVWVKLYTKLIDVRSPSYENYHKKLGINLKSA